jgi:hypothetical protein
VEEMIQGTKCKLSLSDSDAPGMFDEITHLDVVWGEMPASLINVNEDLHLESAFAHVVGFG